MASFSKHSGPYSNQKFYARDFRNTYRFRPDVNPPRLNFEGYVNFVFNRSVLQFLANNNLTFKTSLSSLVRSATLPGVTFRNDTKNQYNKKKIVQTGIDFTPVQFKVLDSINNEWLTILMKYMAYSHMEPRNKNNFRDRDLHLNNTFMEDSLGEENKMGNEQFASNEAGFNLQLEQNFFDRIDLILYHGGRGVQYSLMRPYIKSFRGGAIEYATASLMEFDFEVDYENFTTYDVANFKLTKVDLDRFEEDGGIKYPGDDFIIKPLGAEVETDFEFLGNAQKGKPGTRPRTSQPTEKAKQSWDDSLKDSITDTLGTGLIGSTISGFLGDAIDTAAVQPTYDDFATTLKNKAITAIADGITTAITRPPKDNGDT